MPGDIDLDKFEAMKKMIPMGKCLDADINVDGGNMGILVCHTNEGMTMESKDDSMTSSLKIVDAKKKKM